MKKIFIAFALIFAMDATAQETTIRILGAYPSHLSLSPTNMTSHLQAIATAWNSSGLPGGSVTTVQLLNGAVAVPVSYPGLPSTPGNASGDAHTQPSIQALRNAWQADVILLFTNHTERCGAMQTQWYNGNFVPGAQGLDLRYRSQWFVPVVNPTCPTWISAHEFGHLAGGGHAITGDRLYSDGRAFIQFINLPEVSLVLYTGTALADESDREYGAYPLAGSLEYSRNSAGYGDDGHENVRTLSITARSIANFYEYPPTPPVLNPPINLYGVNLGCVNGVETRHDLYWSNDPGTTAQITHYEVWKSQPVGNPFIYGWTVYSAYSQSYVAGATARARANACSGSTCSALSVSYYDAAPMCGGG
jgi:hypothetical protein